MALASGHPMSSGASKTPPAFRSRLLAFRHGWSTTKPRSPDARSSRQTVKVDSPSKIDAGP